MVSEMNYLPFEAEELQMIIKILKNFYKIYLQPDASLEKKQKFLNLIEKFEKLLIQKNTIPIGKAEVEYGGGAYFAQARMIDAKGNTMLCACGQPAGAGVIGKESYHAWCTQCMPRSTTEKLIIGPLDEARDKSVQEWVIHIPINAEGENNVHT